MPLPVLGIRAESQDTKLLIDTLLTKRAGTLDFGTATGITPAEVNPLLT